MKSQTTWIYRLAVCFRECQPHGWLLAASLLLPLAVYAQQTEGKKVIEQQPSTPQVQESDVKTLPKDQGVKRWKPGDPVRVMEDLREDPKEGDEEKKVQTEGQTQNKPIVHKPIAPRVLDKDVKDLSKVKPYKPGDPVRVIPDLKESDAQK